MIAPSCSNEPVYIPHTPNVYGVLFPYGPCSQELPAFPPAIPPQERKPIRVLGLFDGIATGALWGGMEEGEEGEGEGERERTGRGRGGRNGGGRRGGES